MILAEYLGVAICLAVGFLIAMVLMGAAWLFSPRVENLQKNTPYECGFEDFGDSRMPFDIRYYLISIIFILFDLEVAFLIPWALVLQDVHILGFISMMIFLLEFAAIFAYLWKKGVLDWD